MSNETLKGRAPLERTEDDILAQAPIRVAFAGETYEVKPLKIIAQRLWRKKFADELNAVMARMRGQVDSSSTEALSSGLLYAFLDFPEKVADLVFAYAPDLPREDIEQNGTEEELARAFSQIMGVAFPFLAQLAMVNTVMRVAR